MDVSDEVKELSELLDVPYINPKNTLRAIISKLKESKKNTEQQPQKVTLDNVLGNSAEEDALYARMRRAQNEDRKTQD